MAGITTHVLDTARGRPAAGVPIVLAFRQDTGTWREIGRGATDDDGRLRTLTPAGQPVESGTYRITFDTGAYFTAQGVTGFYPEASIVFEVRDGADEDAGTIGLGLARFRRVVREYFAICDSYYKALRQATAGELETVDMARRAIHDRATRQLLEALEGKVETDFTTARRLFTLICLLHIRG